MNNILKKTNRKISLHNILLLLVFFVLGYLSFNYLHSASYTFSNKGSLDLFWYVYETLEEKYPFEEPSNEDKVYGAIHGFVDSYGDDYSAFLSPQENEFFSQTISGEFGGIGAEIGVS